MHALVCVCVCVRWELHACTRVCVLGGSYMHALVCVCVRWELCELLVVFVCRPPGARV